MSPKKERVIIDFRNLEDAAKVEETVRTGYCETIVDNLNVWTAVEEDMIESYTGLAKRLGPKSGASVEELADESKETLTTLRELLKSFEVLSERRAKRIQRLKSLKPPS